MAPVKTAITHEVAFRLDPGEGDVVRSRGTGWVRLTNVTISLRPDGTTRVWAAGDYCRKDGTPDKRRGGPTLVSVDLPDPKEWIAWAWAAVGPKL